MALGSFRLDYEYEIDYECYFSILVFRLHIIQDRPISSHELLSQPNTNMENEGSGNVTVLKLENRTRTQSRTRSPI